MYGDPGRIIDDESRGARSDCLPQEIMTVEPLSAERDKDVTGRNRPRVGRDGAEGRGARGMRRISQHVAERLAESIERPGHHVESPASRASSPTTIFSSNGYDVVPRIW